MRSQGKRKGAKRRPQDERLIDSCPSAGQIPRAIKTVSRPVRLFKKVLAHSGVLTTAATGFLVAQAVTGSNAVTSCSAWTATSEVWQEFRILGIEVDFLPIVNTQSNFTTPPSPMLAVGTYSSGAFPGTYDGIAESAGCKIVNGYRPFRFSASCKGFIDGLSWWSTAGTIATASTFGICIADPGAVPAGPVSQAIIRWTVRYLVEFRTAQ